jgi:nitrite reductase/ring-hydroxylating ferredoxin subunit
MNDTLSAPENQPDHTASDRSITRQDFISLAWKALLGLSGMLSLAGLWRFFSYKSASARPVIFDLGPANELPRNAMIVLSEAQAVIRPTEDGFQAISLICPHLGCLVDPRKDGFYCPCHGSRFELDGAVIKGPAVDPLTELPLRISEEGHLQLDISGTS